MDNPYSFDGIKFEIKIEIPDAYRIKNEHHINLLKLFEENNLDVLTSTFATNDELMIDIWWGYVGTKFSNREECVNKLTRDSLTKFKEAFWAAIVNFSDPVVKPILLDIKKRMPGLLKKLVSTNLDQIENSQPNESSNSTS